MLDVLLQERRATEAPKTFFTRLLGEYDVPEAIHTDKFWSYGAAIRELPVLHGSTSKCYRVLAATIWSNNRIDQPDNRNESRPGSNDHNELRNSLLCTPAPPIFITRSERQFQPVKDG